jgi:hypothetical protein
MALELRFLRETFVASIKVTMVTFPWLGPHLRRGGASIRKATLASPETVQRFALGVLVLCYRQPIDLGNDRRDIRL